MPQPRAVWGACPAVASSLVVAVLFAAAACSGPAIPTPDLTGMEPQVAEALGEARTAVRARPDSADAWGDLGALYDAHLLTELAVTCYRRATVLAPDDFRWVYLLAIAREIQGADTPELTELFGRAIELDPSYAPAHVRFGDALWRRGDYDAARRTLERAIELDPNAAMAHRRLGQVVLQLGDARQASQHLARAVTLEPRDLAAYSGLAQALMRLGQTERAAQIRERARGLEPVIALDDRIYAEQVFMRNISSSGAFARGTAAVRQGDFATGVRDLKVVLAQQPEHASAHYWIGVAHRALGDGDAAAEHLGRAATLDPSMAPARLQLAGLLSERGRYREAIEHFRRADELGALDADGHFAYALALEGAGRSAAAREQFEAAVRLDPGHRAAARL